MAWKLVGNGLGDSGGAVCKWQRVSFLCSCFCAGLKIAHRCCFRQLLAQRRLKFEKHHGRAQLSAPRFAPQIFLPNCPTRTNSPRHDLRQNTAHKNSPVRYMVCSHRWFDKLPLLTGGNEIVASAEGSAMLASVGRVQCQDTTIR